MYKNFLIIASKKDPAGINITTHLSQYKGFNFYLVEDEIVFTENLDLEKINKYDFVIFASRHSSGKGEKALTIHSVGNFRSAEFGGEKGRVSMTSALFQKFLFEKLNKNAKDYNLNDFQITLEATHHGPLIDKPCLFIEIGSSEDDYKDRRAGFIVAKAIYEAVNNFEENNYHEIAVAVGGPHYCPNFNKIQLSSNVAISHVIPQYVFPLTEEMILEVIKKTEEEVDFVLLDWKGLGSSDKREEIITILDKNHIDYKKSFEIYRNG